MNVLIVDRPGSFRDALASAVAARGARVHQSDGALDALGKLSELAPGLIVVGEGSGPPDVASTVRLVRRKLGDVAVYHLYDPSAGPHAADARPLSRLEHAEALARILITSEPAPAPAEELDAEPEAISLQPSAPLAAPPPPPPPHALAAAKPHPAPPAHAPATPPAAASPAIESDAALLAEIEPLVHQGRWPEVVELVSKREPDAQGLSPRVGLLYAIALKEAPGAGAARPGVDPDLLGVRAVASLLRLGGESTTALIVAKRVLRKRPLEWQREPPRRFSIVLTVIALALGAAAGLAFDQHLIKLLFG